VLVTHSPLLRARTVEIRGASHLTDAQVGRLAGVSSGTNVLYLDPAAAVARLERDPWVADASVTTDLPSTVRIAVRERVPVLAVDEGGSFRLLAGNGTSLEKVDRDPGLPQVNGSSGIRSRRTASLSPTTAAVALAPMAPSVLGRIHSVSLDAGGRLVLQLDSGTRVILGDASQATAKSRSLAALLKWADAAGQSLRDVDLESPSAPTAHLGSRVVGAAG
jgi:cell division protein FtsQ